MGECICSNTNYNIQNEIIFEEKNAQTNKKEIILQNKKDENLSFLESIIFKQKQNNICKIIKKNNIFGTGFLCLIPYPDKKNTLPVLFTCNNILEYDDINPGKEIKLLFNNNFEKILKIDESRLTYTSDINEYNVTIIEIKKEDGFDINNMLQIDYDIYEENDLINNYKNKLIYIINYKNDLNSGYYLSTIKDIDSKNNKIEHLCPTEEESSGAPIINIENFKVIGIHSKNDKNKNINIGTVIKSPINAFNKLLIDDKSKNEIFLKLEITNKDINKKIYFLDNSNFIDKKTGQKHFHDNLKELNESNTKLFINNIKYKFKKYFKPQKEGIYMIKIKLNKLIRDCSYMFYNCYKLIYVDLSYFNTKYVTNMSYMFYNCSNLLSIDLGSFDKIFKDMLMVITDYTLLKDKFSYSFNTKHVTNMSHMFNLCTNLTNIDLSSFDTKNVTNMESMFEFCYNLINIDLNSFNIKNVDNMSMMFFGCSKLLLLDLSSFDIRNDANIKDILFMCPELKLVKIKKNFFDKIKKEINNDEIKIKCV